MKIFVFILALALISPVLVNADTGGRGGDGGSGSWGLLIGGNGGSGGNGGPGKKQDTKNDNSKKGKLEVEAVKLKKYILNID